MSKRFHMRVGDITDRRTVSRIQPLFANCDPLIERITEFYNRYEDVLSSEDTNQILSMLTFIESHNKSVANTKKREMHQIISQMVDKYHVGR